MTGSFGHWYLGTSHSGEGDTMQIKDFGSDRALVSYYPMDIKYTYFPADWLLIQDTSTIELTYNTTLANPSGYSDICVAFVYINDSCKAICSDHSYTNFDEYCVEDVYIKENNTVFNKTVHTKAVFPLHWFENDTYIKQIVLMMGSAQAHNQYISLFDINFTNFLNGTNDLPEINVTLNKTEYCVNNFTSSVTINYSQSVYDPEGNTIYYGRTNLSKTYWEPIIKKFETMSTNIWDYGSYDIDSSFKDYVNTLYSCNIWNDVGHNGIFYNSSAWNIIPYETEKAYTWDSGYHYVLEMTDVCQGYDPMLALDFRKNGQEQLFASDLWDFNQEGYEFNLSFYDYSKKNLINKLKFNYSYDDFLIYDWTGSTWVLIHNTSGTSKIEYSYFIDTTNDIFNLSIYQGSTTPQYNLTPLYTSYPLRNIVFEIGPDTIVRTSRFRLYGASEEIEWESTPFTETELGYGIRNIKFYVTDDMHLNPLEYNTVSYWINVKVCNPSQSTSSGIFSGNPDMSGTDFNIFGLIKFLLGNRMVNYLEALEDNSLAYERGRTLLWVIWLIMFFGTLIGGSILFGGASMAFALFISSIICSFMAFFLDYEGSMIAFLIITAFSLALPLAKHFLGSGDFGRLEQPKEYRKNVYKPTTKPSNPVTWVRGKK